MVQALGPEYFANKYLEEVTSSEVRFKAGNTITFPAGTLQNAAADGTHIDGTRMPVLVGASYLTLTEADSGSVIACGAAEDFVLPALTAANTGANGMYFKFVVITTATSLTITADTGDLLRGGVSVMSTTAGGENDAFSADGTDDLIISMNGTTTGGIIGSFVELHALSTTAWVVSGGLIGSGTLVTPFS